MSSASTRRVVRASVRPCSPPHLFVGSIRMGSRTIRQMLAARPGRLASAGLSGNPSECSRQTNEEGNMAALTPEQRDAYWRRTSRLMWIIMALWVLFSFIIPAFAVQLNQIKIFGFPLGFYMSAQGSLIFYVVVCFWNASAQNKIDQEFGVAED